MDKWYQRSYRRNLVDMHITDWDERFLSQFDPQHYVDTVCLAHPTAAMVYAHSHVGHCYYPTGRATSMRRSTGATSLARWWRACTNAGWT